MVARTPLDIVTEYYDVVWTGQDVERIRWLCTDPLHRHDPASNAALTHDEQIARMHGALAKRLKYKFAVKQGNNEYVTLVWQAVSAAEPTIAIAGIQVMRVQDGRIAEVWNALTPQLWVPQD